MRQAVLAAYATSVRRRRRRASSVDISPAGLFGSGEAGGWWDASDLTTLFQDSAGTVPVTADGDPVGMWQDKSGNGNHLLQASATARPLYKTDGTNHWLEADGVNDYLRATFTVTQPWERVSALRQVSWTINEFVLGGVALDAGRLYQRTSSPRLAIYSGTPLELAAAANPAVGADGVVTERHNGASSRISGNSGVYTEGAAGATLPGGLTMFASHGPTSWGNARMYFCVMRAGTMSDDEIEGLRTLAATKAGVTL